MITFKIPIYADRESLVVALANSGYLCRVRKEQGKRYLADAEYLVEVEMPDMEAKGDCGRGCETL